MSQTTKNMFTVKDSAKLWLKSSLLLGAGLSTLALASTASAQDAAGDEVIVTGIRQSLQNALVEKRQADSLVEVILAEDIGKLPDQNLAEVLENITGVQITRQAGVGTGVQIRGTSSNRIEINGVGTVGADTGRSGISFEDISPSIIAGLEVIKSPEAKTTEGAVGGTVNLRTIRPLDLKGTLASARFQLEDSSLSQDGLTPRFSAALGDNWENAKGQEIGIVVSGSYTESDNSAFRPRLDRDNSTNCAVVNGSAGTAVTLADGTAGQIASTCPAGESHFLGVQFLNQVQVNQEFETLNLAGSIEAKPTPNLRLYLDGVYNDQTRRQESSRAQVSNVSQQNGRSDGFDSAFVNFTEFDTVDLGTNRAGQDLGDILVATAGSFIPQQLGTFPLDNPNSDSTDNGRGSPFLRGSSDSGSRFTETSLIRLGGEWDKGPLTLGAEFSHTESDTVSPNLSLTLNFINPNSDLFGTRNENGTPIAFDLTDGIAFGIDTSSPFAPTTEQLLDPANYVLDGGGTFSANERENSEDTVRFDASYDLADSGSAFGNFFSSIDAGYRYTDRNVVRDNIRGGGAGSASLAESLRGDAIAGLLAPIPDNFGSGTGNDLFISNLLHINPELGSDNLRATGEAINAAIRADSTLNQGSDLDLNLRSRDEEFFEITEKTNAIYGQVNFNSEIGGFGFRGNAGARWFDTEVESSAFVDDGTGNLTFTTVEGSFNKILPRVNLAFDATENIVIRAAYNEDINRPNFANTSPARTFPNAGGVNSNSVAGNVNLEPEDVRTFDVSADWYFAPEGVFSIGYFNKRRSGLFGNTVDFPDETGGIRDVTAPCENGGIFSPDTLAGIFDPAASGDTVGVCVGDQTTFNSDNATTQEGIEVAFQYNLAAFEDRLGWASGFGLTANYTHQTEDNETGFTPVTGNRNVTIFGLQGFDPAVNPVLRETATLLDFSEDSYNVTGYYEKYGLSARLRYTWRSEFATNDLPGTGNVFNPLGFRGFAESRGQLNGSVSYDVTDQLTLNVDAVNLTESSQDIFCTEGGDLLCYEGITDRRVIFGASYTF